MVSSKGKIINLFDVDSYIKAVRPGLVMHAYTVGLYAASASAEEANHEAIRAYKEAFTPVDYPKAEYKDIARGIRDEG